MIDQDSQECGYRSQKQKDDYRAFASAVDKPTNRTGNSVCDEIYLIRETITYKDQPVM